MAHLETCALPLPFCRCCDWVHAETIVHEKPFGRLTLHIWNLPQHHPTHEVRRFASLKVSSYSMLEHSRKRMCLAANQGICMRVHRTARCLRATLSHGLPEGTLAL